MYCHHLSPFNPLLQSPLLVLAIYWLGRTTCNSMARGSRGYYCFNNRAFFSHQGVLVCSFFPFGPPSLFSFHYLYSALLIIPFSSSHRTPELFPSFRAFLYSSLNPDGLMSRLVSRTLYLLFLPNVISSAPQLIRHFVKRSTTYSRAPSHPTVR